MADQHKDIEQRLQDLQAHVERVQRAQQEIEGTLSEQDHQLRRVNDSLERGERSDALEGERDRLTQNQESDRRDQASNSEQLEQLRKEREDLERRLQELRGNTAAGTSSGSASSSDS